MTTRPHGMRFLVRRDALAETRLESIDVDAPPRPGAVRVRIEHFAFTANNITYAKFGAAMHYWRFFPAGDGWGCIPVWGFGSVEASAAEGVAAGERLYGYWPMASHAVLHPAAVGRSGFSDGSAHRADLPAVYNRYQRVAAVAGHDPAHEGEYALLQPLFATAWLIDDLFAEARDFGARSVLLSSASSKTAYATAFCMAHRAQAGQGHARIVGLTSPLRMAFARGLGVYDELIEYGAIERLGIDEPLAYVDFAGDAALRRAVHERFAARLAYSCSVGGTHHEALGSARALPGPKPELFFAPARMQQRSAAPPQGPGRDALLAAMGATWREFLARVTRPDAPWLVVETHRGADAVREAYLQTLHGRGDPQRGLLLGL